MQFNMGIPFLLLSLLIFLYLPISSSTSSNLSEGSSLSVENPEDLLISPSEVFSSGFYPIGNNAYSFAIWFSKPSCNNNCTIVWMANRDFPVNGKHSKLLLQENGNLIVTDAGKSTAWSTDTTSLSSTDLRLNDSGNLVLYNMEGVVLWQSFDSPTDTLLPLQRLTRDMQLVSARSRTNFSAGFYKLLFNNDNSFSLLYDGPDFSSLYWPYAWRTHDRFYYNSSRIAMLDSLGMFTSSDNLTFLSADYGSVTVQRRLTLDPDGNLRLYSREEESTGWVVSWLAIPEMCRIHGICGPNSTCFYDPVSGGKCSCLPGYKMKNSTDWFFGCEPKFNFSCDNCTEVSRFIQLSHVEFYGNDFGFYPNYTMQMCEEVCLQLFSCKGFQYKFSEDNVANCYPKTLLVSGQYTPSFDGDFYLKVPKTSHFPVKKIVPGFGLDCSGELLRQLDRSYKKSNEKGTLRFMLWFATALAGVEIISILCVWCFLIQSHKTSGEARQDYQHIAAAGFKRFTYSELKRATRNFSEEIGRGAGGVVYKGTLSDNRTAAIKKLNIAIQGEAEFLTEANIIGKLNHMNLIDMWGYCVEGKHRLLVYEFLEHGSLAEKLSSKALDWSKRYDIVLGTARGLAYLHEECLEWVLHCDVKPQNILLDSNYQPKVSDFGLSKLLNRGGQNNSSFSRMRGTRGYMAPEWVFNLPITSKVDVYSYGIVVLEIVTGKSPAMGIQAMPNSGEIGYRRLVAWVREKKCRVNGMVSLIDEIIDPALKGEYDKAKMEILVTMALQCVEEDKDARPTMSKVVEMLLHHENNC